MLRCDGRNTPVSLAKTEKGACCTTGFLSRCDVREYPLSHRRTMCPAQGMIEMRGFAFLVSIIVFWHATAAALSWTSTTASLI
jgi:hypothetical protein